MNRLYIVTGEASGDLHASYFISRFIESNPQLQIKGMGGSKLQQKGVQLQFNYEDIAVMGIFDVIKQRKFLKQRLEELSKSVIEFNPDMLLLVDSSGFNLRLAKRVKALNSDIKIHYYIAPKYWAWGKWRLKSFRKWIDHLYCIFPFEVAFFKDNGFKNVEYVGNPTLLEIKNHSFAELSISANNVKPIIALLPGSRKQEIQQHMNLMIEVAKEMKDYQFVVAKAEKANFELFEKELEFLDIKMVEGQTWDLLNASKAAIVCSGTATLETAIIGCPQVVVYKTNKLNYFLGKLLIKVPYISLVNLIAKQELVKEFIQHEATSKNICNELRSLLQDETKSKSLQTDTLIESLKV